MAKQESSGLAQPQQESYIDLLMATSDNAGSRSPPPSPQQPAVQEDKVISTYRARMEELRNKEVSDLITYVKEEDPETCINILFVLSQCGKAQQHE